MIKIVMLCLFVTVLVCLFMRPDPCTHDSTQTNFVTMDEFMAMMKASNDVLKTQQRNNEVSLIAMKLVQDAVVKNRKTILQHQSNIQSLENMVLKNMDFNETNLEIVYDTIQSLEDYIMRINELHDAEIEIIAKQIEKIGVSK